MTELESASHGLGNRSRSLEYTANRGGSRVIASTAVSQMDDVE